MPSLQKKNINQSLPPSEPACLIDAEELAKDYKVATFTIYKWVKKQLIPVWKINSRFFLFDRQEVREALRRNRIPAK